LSAALPLVTRALAVRRSRDVLKLAQD